MCVWPSCSSGRRLVTAYYWPIRHPSHCQKETSRLTGCSATTTKGWLKTKLIIFLSVQQMQELICAKQRSRLPPYGTIALTTQLLSVSDTPKTQQINKHQLSRHNVYLLTSTPNDARKTSNVTNNVWDVEQAWRGVAFFHSRMLIDVRQMCCFDIIPKICQLWSLPSAPPALRPTTHPHRPRCHLLSGPHPCKAKLLLLT